PRPLIRNFKRSPFIQPPRRADKPKERRTVSSSPPRLGRFGPDAPSFCLCSCQDAQPREGAGVTQGRVQGLVVLGGTGLETCPKAGTGLETGPTAALDPAPFANRTRIAHMHRTAAYRTGWRLALGLALLAGCSTSGNSLTFFPQGHKLIDSAKMIRSAYP